MTEHRTAVDVCRICHGVGLHQAGCPVADINMQIREITSHVGMFVANMHDSLETIGQALDLLDVFLRDERRP